MDIGTIAALIIAGISAIATVVIAVFTYKTIQAYEKQVQIGQDQVKVSQEQQFNQFRPILQPVGSLEDIIERSAGKPHIKWGYQNQVIDGLRNIGVGPAFNIYGILFGLFLTFGDFGIAELFLLNLKWLLKQIHHLEVLV